MEKEKNTPEQKQVKIWRQSGIFKTYESAEEHRKMIKKKNSSVKDVKIHKLAKGFVVKVWEGHMQSAPTPKDGNN